MARTKVGWTVACLSLFLWACDDPPSPISGPQVVDLTVVSGDGQRGKVGRELGEPFMVRATDRRGRGVGGAEVIWTITPGEAAFWDGTAFTTEGVFEDQFEGLDEDVPHGCLISAQTIRHTDSDGIAQVRFMPTWFGPVTVTASAHDASEPVTFTADASDPGAVLSIEAGNHHEGKAGDWDDVTFGWSRLELRVVDGQRNPVTNVPVRWAVTSGDVRIQVCHSGILRSNWTRTGSDGIADVIFRMAAFGTSTVAAAVPGVPVSPVTFTVTATGVVILLDAGWFAAGAPAFVAPDFSSDATSPNGVPVEWVSLCEAGRITSTSVPPGGEPFDSGELSQGERFEFVPEVAGTWEYVDQVSGATGTLAAR
jgi:hypothetical protein